MPKKIIFLIEDDRNISELIRLVLEGEGYSVKLFQQSTGIETHILKHKPALILTDLCIEGGDGMSLIKNIKKNKTTAHIPVVIVSAKNSLDKIAEKSGADGFLPKPFDIDSLTKLVEKFVK